MKILANDGISALGKSLLEDAGFTVITEKVAQNELATVVNEQGIEMILVRSATTVRKEVIDACPGVKLIGRIDNEPYFDANVIAYYADKFRENLLNL